MSSPAHDIALELDDEGFGAFAADSGWSISAAQEPSEPPTTITVFDTASESIYEDLDFTQARFQVRVRGPSYPDAYAKQQAMRSFLVKEINFTRSGFLYMGIDMLGQIEMIGRDDDNRYVLVANYRLYRKPEEVILPIEEP